MPNLECSVHNCSHNRDNKCCMNGIEVGESGSTNASHTCCRNFITTEYVNSNKEHHPRIALSVECEAAGCIYNDNHTCRATEVVIGGGSTACCVEDTDCLTFVCR